MKGFLCFAALLAVASAAKCPSLDAVSNFTVPDFMGTWYQQYSINTNIFQGSGHCAKAEYSYDEDIGVITVVNSEKTMFGGQSKVQGSAVLAEPNAQNGKLLMTLETTLGEKIGNVLVLDTDYTTYAILWTCQDVLTIPYESSWTMTREETLSNDVNEKLQEVWTSVADNGGPLEKFWKPTSQKNCF